LRARLVRAGLVAVAVLLLLIPTAQARVIDGGSATCITHTGRVASPRGATARDVVRLSGADRLSRWISNHPRSADRAAAQVSGAPTTVEVAFHVIRKDLTRVGGNVPLSQIRDQMKVLNASYGGATGGARTGFTFDLLSVDRTRSAQWFHMAGNGKDKAMKTALKVGGLDTLNIYSTDLGNTLLGYAYLAQDAAAVGVLDGVVIHYGSLPGGPFGAHYSQGDTATHEVGHWLNLLHTFQGGCTDPGDYIDDTPAEASPAFQCPVGRDTCPATGLDPIRNFMDYTYDNCMNEFTADQAVRMQQAWAAYRAP
jgi:Pregnancy-associated plasma protein-A